MHRVHPLLVRVQVQSSHPQPPPPSPLPCSLICTLLLADLPAWPLHAFPRLPLLPRALFYWCLLPRCRTGNCCCPRPRSPAGTVSAFAFFFVAGASSWRASPSRTSTFDCDRRRCSITSWACWGACPSKVDDNIAFGRRSLPPPCRWFKRNTGFGQESRVIIVSIRQQQVRLNRKMGGGF